MLRPTINFRHSDEARSAASLVLRSNDRALKKMGREALDKLCLDMGNDPSAETNRVHLINYLRVVAQQIDAETKEDSNAAFNDPAYRREAFFTKIHQELEDATEKYGRYLVRLNDPAQFDYSPVNMIVQLGARVWACNLLLRYEDAEMDLASIKAEVTREIVRRARSGAFRSTNVVSNVVEEAQTSALADLIDSSWF
jgi:hypothetical protein